MTNNGCLLHLEPDSWQILPEGAAESTECVRFPPAELYEQPKLIAEHLRQQTLEGQSLVVGLGPQWCLAVTTQVASPQILRKRSAMRYHLEEWIPWSAEDFVVDYVSQQQTAFMVAVRIEPLASFLRALEDLDISVAALCPTALLATADFLSRAGDLPEHFQLAWQTEQHLELFTVQKRHVMRWTRCSTTTAEFAREIRATGLVDGAEFPLVLVDAKPEWPEELQRLGIQAQAISAEKVLPAAQRFAARVVAGTEEAPFELKRDELAGTQQKQRLRKEFARLQLTAALLFISLTAGFWLRGNLYQDAGLETQAALAEVHQQIFPGKDIPSDVRAAVASEFRQLQATRSPGPALPARADADILLQRLLAALPADLRFRLPEIQIEGDRVSLGGEVRSNSDADQIANALREQGFTVESPKTQRLADKGFSVRLTAKPSVLDAPSTKKGR